MDKHDTVIVVAVTTVVASLLCGTAFAFFGLTPTKRRASSSITELNRPLLISEGKDDEHEMKEMIRQRIVAHKDFPQTGILFQDFFPVFQNHQASQALFTLMFRHLRSTHGKIDVIVGLEARGFVLGPVLALYLDASFVPIRKAGKLPGRTERTTYQKEYGVDALEIQQGAIRPGDHVVIVDDLLATGGTVSATADLITRLGGIVTEAAVVIELVDLKGRDKCKGFPVWGMFEM